MLESLKYTPIVDRNDDQRVYRAMRNEFFKEDEDPRVRMGRLGEREAHDLEHLFDWRSLFRNRLPAGEQSRREVSQRWDHEMIQQSKHRRVRLVLAEAGADNRKEAVVKVLSNTKTRAGAQRTLRYITEPKSHDKGPVSLSAPRLFNELNNQTSPDAAYSLLRGWSGDTDNDRQRKSRGNIVSWHLVLSIDEPANEEVLTKLTLAAANTVDEVFAENYFSVFWCLHTDKPDHPHVHLLLKARSETGERLRFDRDGDFLYALRDKFARNLTDAGLSYQATRREDRANLRWEIVRGETILRRGRALADIHTGVTKLRERAPTWWRDFGETSYETLKSPLGAKGNRLSHIVRRLNDARGSRLRRPVTTFRGLKLEQLLPTVRALLGELSYVYRDPAKSLESILSFIGDGGTRDGHGRYASENKKLCLWLTRKEPRIFGQTIHSRTRPAQFHPVIEGIERLPFHAVRPFRQITMKESAPTKNQLEISRKQAAYSLKRLLAWFSQQPHRVDQIEEFETRIRFVETTRVTASIPASSSFSMRRFGRPPTSPVKPKTKSAEVLETPAESLIKVPDDQSNVTRAKKRSRRSKSKSRSLAIDL